MKRMTFLSKMAVAMAICAFGFATGAPVYAQQEPTTPITVVGVGDKFYDFELHDVEGNYSYLEDYVGTKESGKYLLALFWTSTCPRCHASFSEVEKYVTKYADSLSVVGIMLSDQHDGWLEMYKYQKPFEWPNLSDGKLIAESAAKNYGIGLYPTFVLIEPSEGRIVKKWSGYKQDSFQAQMKPYFLPVK